MPTVVLLGDSIFDNAAYTAGGPDVIHQVRTHLPADWSAILRAMDGATTRSVAGQLARLPADATHLVLSVGGNDALHCASIMERPVSSAAQAIGLLANVSGAFEADYRDAVEVCLATGLPLILCTIYNGRFDNPQEQRIATTALMVFNDVILRAAAEHHLTVIDLRLICSQPEDYANPIEPSSVGGEKIAGAIARAVAGSASATPSARIML